MSKLLKALLLPPLGPLLLAIAGPLVGRRWPRVGRVLLVTGLTLLFLLSMPAVAGLMLGTLQGPALSLSGPPAADAIVVLSGDTDATAPEYGGPGIGRLTLQRVRYGAFLQRRTGLPLLLTGGAGRAGLTPLGDMMRAVVEDELGAKVRWVERESHNTYENATRSAPLLKEAGVRRIYLVTHAWHMPRARACFEAQGLKVVAAPTGFRGPALEGLMSLVPSWSAVRDSSLALHEWLGLLYYHLVYL